MKQFIRTIYKYNLILNCLFTPSMWKQRLKFTNWWHEFNFIVKSILELTSDAIASKETVILSFVNSQYISTT